MTDHVSHNDHPIENPSEGRFGVYPFARAPATSVRNWGLGGFGS